ncbi:MAG: pentapeptide repeat-containing protein [Candidatus Omnitrophica bacterium]|nr:pentapeptide repeat-containing protein [Candidatus Omnitrophota bacterium]
MIKCKTQNCRNHPVFSSEFCWEHITDKETYRERLREILENRLSLKGANFAKADLSNFDLSRQDLSAANFSRSNLSFSSLFDTDLRNAELLGADFSGSDLTSSNLEGCDLTRSSLSGARLWHANLKNANLIEANLNQCDLWNAKLFNARLWRTNLLEVVSLSKKNFRGRTMRHFNAYRINEKGVMSAEEAYRSLKKHFITSGKYNDASWASFKEKTMERLLLKKKRNPAYLPSLIMDFLCGYGEKPHRIILSSLFVILGYATAYLLLDAILYTPSIEYHMSISDYVYYSGITFTTVGYGDFIPKASSLFRFLAASEAFIGTFMMGLFIFTLARKYSAR